MKLFLQNTKIPEYLQDFTEDFEFVKDMFSKSDLGFIYSGEGLCLELPKDLGFKSFKVDFLEGVVARRKHFGGSQELAKAIGLKNGTKEVLDLTMGWGRESFLLASWGLQVRAFEKDLKVFLLVLDAWERWKKTINISSDKYRLDLIYGPFQEHIFKKEAIYDCIYFDPMFPPRDKKAKVKKEMQILQLLLGKDSETSFSESDLVQLLSLNFKRLVIKRPINAPPLAPGVNKEIKAKGIRFDLYFR